MLTIDHIKKLEIIAILQVDVQVMHKTNVF